MTPHPTAVLNVVGLTRSMLGADTPHLSALARDGACTPIAAVLPAVTCTAQATYVTGLLPRDHGIVGNGWYFRDLAQVWLWRQSNHLVYGEKVWDTARRRDPSCTCAKMFWWFNMYSTADWSATPRPIYPADGRKVFDIYTYPSGLRDRLVSELGAFPFPEFWGPNAGLGSSEWIAEAAERVDRWHSPTLLLVYLPHLDYNLQRYGVSDPRTRKDIAAVDAICGRLIKACRERGRRIIVLSEYGIADVDTPVHINRVLREAGFVAIRNELETDTLDAGASDAFAVVDHQLAHVYVRDSRRIADVKRLLENVPGIDMVLDRQEQHAYGIDHARSGELVAIARGGAWFTYYFWLDEQRAPDYARTIDIHRKPGYDPAELFLDPTLTLPKARVAATLAKKALGFRYLMNVIPLDATLVRGSHGRMPASPEEGAVLISSERRRDAQPLSATAVRDVILDHLFN